jgi:hypothetical protein
MTVSDAVDEITCATYTHARRHPMVLGQIGGWTPPFQLTMPQLGVLIVTFLVEVKTWPMWFGHLPRGVAVVVAVILPVTLAWVVRRARYEGRSLPRAAVGWISSHCAPRNGTLGGRPNRRSAVADLRPAVVFVAHRAVHNAGGHR